MRSWLEAAESHDSTLHAPGSSTSASSTAYAPPAARARSDMQSAAASASATTLMGLRLMKRRTGRTGFGDPSSLSAFEYTGSAAKQQFRAEFQQLRDPPGACRIGHSPSAGTPASRRASTR